MNSPNLTPEVIKLIEEAASARYGVPLKYAPASSPAPKVVSQPVAPVLVKPQPAPLTGPKVPPIDVLQEIVRRASSSTGVAAVDIDDLIPGKSDVRTALLNQMIAAGLLVKRGHGKATMYHDANAGKSFPP